MKTTPEWRDTTVEIDGKKLAVSYYRSPGVLGVRLMRPDGFWSDPVAVHQSRASIKAQVVMLARELLKEGLLGNRSLGGVRPRDL
jgi:hypothetical protein